MTRAERRSELIDDTLVMLQDQIEIATAIRVLEHVLFNYSEKARSHIVRQFMQEIKREKCQLLPNPNNEAAHIDVTLR